MRLLEAFAKLLATYGKALDLVVGGTPISGNASSLVSDGILLAEDAVRHGGAMTFAGMLTGVEAGALAGKVAAEAFSSGDVSRSWLEAYEDLWRRSEGRRVGWNKKVRTIYNSLNEGELNRVILSLQSEDTGQPGCEGRCDILSGLKTAVGAIVHPLR